MLGDGLAVGEGEAVGDGLAVGEGVELGDGDALGDGDTDGEGEASGIGCSVEFNPGDFFPLSLFEKLGLKQPVIDAMAMETRIALATEVLIFI